MRSRRQRDAGEGRCASRRQAAGAADWSPSDGAGDLISEGESDGAGDLISESEAFT